MCSFDTALVLYIVSLVYTANHRMVMLSSENRIRLHRLFPLGLALESNATITDPRAIAANDITMRVFGVKSKSCATPSAVVTEEKSDAINGSPRNLIL